MKRLFLLLSLLLCFTTASLAQAIIKTDKTVHNFGKVTSDKPVSCTFVFTNTGKEPLVLNQVYSNCGCTVSNFTKEPVESGKTGKITVTYNGKGRFPGHFKNPITVRSNAANGLVRIYIEGNLIVKD